ncbi:bifunctional Eukaryotic translation initiation factor 3 subunit M/Eukaryotic translation initiation factor 3 subunit M eIF3m-COP9 signalosome complex subunit 7 COPS7/Proteasome component (PCI) domain/Winged helix DNA-binding domain superfamily [Babesia duncani]|uniref:Eukaryotic translation initiation factor 3 subunit M n=1 Tax=Babesia duncani TaxID=323732 RepID=A0AAD9UQQ3_9APIC|nr:bifunctional Eukaryotic translation initiation factor 3 subunit M/Eukaryotic translation initiation factor 3 subunit M eIF3m-COP9 signalosome complex subunit 7 COPS7/Proteasome component (PCI) domain/Winged helix DNA-binding domain superfamily [Babesia duncani]
MATFVPLSQDTEGAVSSTSLGDWILAIIKVREPSKTANYYSQLLNQFQELDGEQMIKDAFQLFELLLSEHKMVFDFLQDAKDNGTTVMLSLDPVSNVETEIQVKYPEALKQVEEYFTVLMYMLQLRFTSSGQIQNAGNLLLRAISDGDSFLDLRLRLLQMLYNSVEPTLPLRATVYIEILEFAAKHDIFMALVPVIKKVEDWMKDWSLDKNGKIYIFHIIAEQLDKLQKHDLAYEYWEKRIKCCDDAATYTKEENVKATAEFVVRSLKADHVLYFDRLACMPAVAHLKETKYAPLVELLRIFIKGDGNDLERFVEKHKEKTFDDLGLPLQLCRDKIRLLSLTSLCQHESQVSIARIQEHLGVDKNNVEQVIVNAISKGVMDALIDQKTQKVIIRSVMQREFSDEQLRILQSNLMQWKGCLDNLINIVANNNVNVPL